MTSGRGALTALHLFLVWATMAAVVPALGFGLVLMAWGGGSGATALIFALGVPLAVVLLAMAGLPARTVVPLCGSVSQRHGWAVLVFVLGTLGVLAGLAAYSGDVDLGGDSTRIALTGVPYAVAAAFFVPDRWIRLGAVAVLAAAVVYGGFIGPTQSRQRRHAAEVARYREHQELLYVIVTPPGMRAARAEAGPASFSVEYHSVRQDAYVALIVRSPLTPKPQCPKPVEKHVTCTVDRHGETRTVRDFSAGNRVITLTRRHHNAEAEVTSKMLDEPALRHLLNTLHPLSDTELEQLMREKVIVHSP
ncbi:hypothetical protein [Streptomyces graminilatus]|uniref:hypothetical protein n=1 Tax=Streptomyces graminilatus TaxID=1464070 RepID=UPI0006E2357F|nr:hypothetical protein [Streptomyces graminilatus]